MNKAEFVDYIAKNENCTKAEADKIIGIFTNNVANALIENKEIALIGFGNFHVANVAERKGRNPQTGGEITIAAHNQPKFSASKKLKDLCNAKEEIMA